MARSRVALLTLLAMLAFAGNSLLCRLALKHTGIDAASFTAIRIVSGAVALWLIVRVRDGAGRTSGGNWLSAIALFGYAATFSYAYLTLTAATGALLLFASVQVTMIGYAWSRGERLRRRRGVGFALALAGVVVLLLPGLQSPPWAGSLLMVGAGVAWGAYSLRGRGSTDPLRVTAGNFARATAPAVGLAVAALPWATVDMPGAVYAILSGAAASGVGYAIWYTALRGLSVTSAATVQLSVPVLAAIGGIVFLDEPLSLRLLIAAVAVLGGIVLVVVERRAA